MTTEMGKENFDLKVDLAALNQEEVLLWAQKAQEILLANNLVHVAEYADKKEPGNLTANLQRFFMAGFQKYCLEANRVNNQLISKAEIFNPLRENALYGSAEKLVEPLDYYRFLCGDAMHYFPFEKVSINDVSGHNCLVWCFETADGFVVSMVGKMQDIDHGGDTRTISLASMQAVFADSTSALELFNTLANRDTSVLNTLATEVWHQIDKDTRFFFVDFFPDGEVSAKDNLSS